MAKGGCNKCTGSCACKAKKPRAKKAPAKRVIGGKAKAPQVVIMGPTPPVANPYQTIVSQSTPGVNKSTRGMQTMETETEKPISRKGGLDISTVTPEMRKESMQYFQVGGPPSLLKGVLEKSMVTMDKIKTGQNKSGMFFTDYDREKYKKAVAPFNTERRINPSRLLNEPPKPTLVTSVIGTEPKPKLVTSVIGTEPKPKLVTSVVGTEKPATLKEFLSTRSPSLVQGALKYALRPPELVVKETQTETEKPKKNYKSGFMSILPEAIRLENVRQRAIGQKPSMATMETQTEPLEVKVAKGQKKSIFDIMQEQERTGKTVSLTGAGRPTFSANLNTALEAAGAPAPAPAPAPAQESPE